MENKDEIEELKDINNNLETLITNVGKGYYYNLSELMERFIEQAEKQTELLEKIEERLKYIENTIESK